MQTTISPQAVEAAQREMANPCPHRFNRAPVEIASTSDGAPILGEFDVDGQPLGIVEVTIGAWSLNAGRHGDMSLAHLPSGMMIELEPEQARDFAALVALISGDTLAQLRSLARQWAALGKAEEIIA